MNDQQANALFEQSIALLQQGKAQEALKHLSKLDQAIPSNPGILYFTATGYSILGNKQKAIQIYERVLRLNPQFIEAYNNIALDLAYLGEHETAIGFIDQALSIRPDFIEAIDNKGCFLNAMGHYPAACKCFERALEINPHDTIALANLAVALIHLGEYKKAKAFAETLLRINPNDYKGHSSLGKIHLRLEEHATAINHFLAANEQNPTDVDTLSDLGITHSEIGSFDLALQYFEKALALNPEHGASHLGLGLMHHDLRKFDQALTHFDANIQDKYRLTLREYNCSITHLHAGNLKQGWPNYAYRWKESNLPVPYLNTANPLWDGHNTESPVLIWHEQGIGDQILFGTLLADAATRAPSLIVRLDERLVPLFQRSLPSIRFIPHDFPIRDTDFKCHAPIGDLARFFRNALVDFKLQPTSYLKPDNSRLTALREGLSDNKPIIGLAWATKGKRALERNLPIDQVVALIQNTLSSTLIDLQYSDTTEDRNRIAQSQGVTIQRLDEVDNFKDIDGLAALITACDLVITCSNSTAHLAGALGKETYLLVPFSRGRHWYWSHIREDGHSMWYPSIRVIPQTVLGDWGGPLSTLEACLKNRTKPDSSGTE
jgi:tetratricopeptide (TPR) repeat protein